MKRPDTVAADTAGNFRLGAVHTPAVMVCVLLVVGVAALWPTLLSLAQNWNEMLDYQHGYLVAAVAIFWLVRARGDLDACAVRPMPIALLPLAGAIVVWAVAYRANNELLQQLCVPAILLIAVLAALGRDAARIVSVPLLYLYVAIPIWEYLVPLLQSLTSTVSEAILSLLQVPASVDDNVVTIPEGKFKIIEGCAGKRYLLIGIAFAAAIAVMQGIRGKRFVFLVGFAALMSMIDNWLRVVVIIYAGHLSNMQHYLVAKEHITFGTFMFVPLLIVVILMTRRLERGQKVVERAPASSAPPPANQSYAAWGSSLGLLFLALLITMTEPALGSAHPMLGQLPLKTGTWQGPLPANEEWQPQFVAPADERRAAYTSGEDRVEVYVNVYGVQVPGHELVFYKNTVVPLGPNGWSIVGQMPARDGAPGMVIAASPDNRWVIARTYRVGSGKTSVPALAQLYYGAYALWRPVPSGAIAIAARCSADCNAAAEVVRRFWRETGADVAGLIPPAL